MTETLHDSLPQREALRESSFETMGCGTCGATARWSDSPSGADYWYLPCGHDGGAIPLLVITRTEAL